MVATASVAVWSLRRSWAVVTVEGLSMEPTFHDGDRVAVRRRRFAVATGDVVVIRPPRVGRAGFVIKRVAAVAGEPVPHGIPVPDAVVPDGKLVLLGDNAEASFDSRVAGYFSADRLLGGVVRRMH